MDETTIWTLEADPESVLAAFDEISASADGMAAATVEGFASLEEQCAAVEAAMAQMSAMTAELAASFSDTAASGDATAASLSGLAESAASTTDTLAAMADSASTDATASGELGSMIDGLIATVDSLNTTLAEDNQIISSLNETIANLEGQIGMLTADEGAAAESSLSLGEALSAMGEMATSAMDALQAAMGPLMMIAGAVAMVGGQFVKMGLDGQKGEALLSGMAGASAQDIQALQGEALKLGVGMDQASAGFYQVESAGYAGRDGILVFDNAMRLAEGGQARASDIMSALTGIMHAYNYSAGQSGQVTDLMAEAILRGKQSAQDFASSIGPLAAAGHNVGFSFAEVTAAEATMTQINPHVMQDAQQLKFLFNATSLSIDSVAASAKKLKIGFDETHYKSMDLIQRLQYLAEISGGTNTVAFKKLVGGSAGLSAALALLSGHGKAFQDNLHAMAHSAGATEGAFQSWENTIPAHMDKVGAAISVFATKAMDALGPQLIPIIDKVTAVIGSMTDLIINHTDQVMPVLAGLAAVIGGAVVAALVALVISIGPVLLALAAFGLVVAGITMLVQQHAGLIGNAFDQMNRRAELATLNMKLKSTQNTLDMAQQNIEHIHHQEEVIEREIMQTHDAHTRHMLQMKLDALEQSEQQQRGVIKNIEKQRQGIEQQMQQLDTSAHMHALRMKEQSIAASQQQAQGVLNHIQAQERGVENAIAHTRDAHTRHMLMMRLEALQHSEAQQRGVIKNIEKQRQGVEKQMGQLQQQINADNGNILVRMIDTFNRVKDAVVNGLGAAFRFIVPILQQIGGFLSSTFVPVWQQLVQMWQTQLMPLFKQFWGAIQPLIPVLEFLGAIVAGVVVLALGFLVGAITGTIKAIAGFLSGLMVIIGGIVQLFTGVMQVIGGIVGFFVDLFTGHFDKLGADLGLIWQGIINIFLGAWNIIKGIFLAAWGIISGYVSGFVQGIIGFFTHLWDMLVGHSIIPDMINGIFQWFEHLVSQGIQFWTNLVTGVLSWAAHMEVMVLSAITEMVNTFLSWLDHLTGGAISKAKDVVSGIAGEIGKLGGMALQWGEDLVKNLISGITSMLGSLGSTAQNVAGTIGKFLHFSKPDEGPLANFDTYAPDMIELFATGLEQHTPRLKQAMQAVASTVSGGIKPSGALPPGGGLSLPASVAGGGNTAGNTALLAQILATLQQRGTGATPSTVINQINNNQLGSLQTQELYNLFNQLAGQAFEAGTRGAY